ncbi:MAG: NDP-sugar synthase, partial [Candidatus Eremiobacteraeota bacterium]|nr:NDP-sugar synthase [Candidatus Eremiobacteraeota bacterium]
REVLDLIPAGKKVSIERETFPLLIESGKPLYAYVTSDYWIDLGRPEQYLDAHRHLFEGAAPHAIDFGTEPIAGPGAAVQPRGTLHPPVYIGKDITIDLSATIGPNTVLGDGTRIGAGARVVGSILWDGVDVGDGACIEEAIVASRARIGAHARIRRGTVIGHDAVIEAGADIPEDSRLVAEEVATG